MDSFPLVKYKNTVILNIAFIWNLVDKINIKYFIYRNLKKPINTLSEYTFLDQGYAEQTGILYNNNLKFINIQGFPLWPIIGKTTQNVIIQLDEGNLIFNNVYIVQFGRINGRMIGVDNMIQQKIIINLKPEKLAATWDRIN